MSENLIDWLKTFSRPMRGYPLQLILDGFGADFFIKFDCEEDPEVPASIGTCDIAVCKLLAEDKFADAIHMISNANKWGVMRFLAALGIQRFDAKTKAAFYGGGSILRTMPVHVPDDSATHPIE